MKLEEGMYVRTKVGKIAKIINKYDNSGSLHNENFVWVLDDSSVLALHSQKAVKASYNLIDLIEKGDYVNGYLVKDIDYAFDDVVMNNKNARRVPYIDCNKNNYIKDIKSIVTKEQFNSVKYEVK